MDVISNVNELKEPALAGHVVYLDSDTIDLTDEIDEEYVEDQLSKVYALEVYREEIRRAEQFNLDKAMALSLYGKEECYLVDLQEVDSVDDKDLEESKPPPKCSCCLETLADRNLRRILLCGHMYCTRCIVTRCRMGVRDRSMVPAHCCRREFPNEYVIEALSADEFRTYERFLRDKPWRSLNLQSDREYAKVVEQNNAVQCPGCGIGVQKVFGCNRMTCLNNHQFCFLCAKAWKTCACEYY